VADFVNQLLESRAGRDDRLLARELGRALDDKRASGAPLGAAEKLAWQVCAVAHCDGIETLLPGRVADIAAGAAFAAARGLPRTAALLADAARGVPVPGPVRMSVQFQGREIEQALPQSTWGATDLALSLTGENLDTAILDHLAEQRGQFTLAAPAAVQARDRLAQSIAALASSASAAELLQRFAAHSGARMHARLSEYDCQGNDSDWLELPVTHRLGAPADPARIAGLKRQYGAPAHDLLDLYALHDGADLYIAQGNTGLQLLPIDQWAENAELVMHWAREVTWGAEPEELPAYLESAIAFGYTPYDSERWILVTEGPFAGCVMLSDTDTIEDKPRYPSLAAFLAALTLDIENVLGNGGFVSYLDGKSDALYYPMRYVAGPGEAA